MKPYTLDNNFVFQYGDLEYDWSKRSQENSMKCRYAKATRAPLPFRQECVETVRVLASQIDRPLQLLLSGGLDSEVVALAMLEAGVNPNAITFRFTDGSNQHEITQVQVFTDRHGIEVTYHDIDIRNWIFSQEAQDMAHLSECHHLDMLSHMKLMEHSWNTGFAPVMGNGDLYAARLPNVDYRMTGRGEAFSWKYVEFEDILAWFRFTIKKGILGGIGFFQHTPEITLSMLEEPLIQQCVNGERPNKMSTRSTKYEVYFKYWPELKMRPKFTGAETLTSLYEAAWAQYGRRDIFNHNWEIPIEDFHRMIK